LLVGRVEPVGQEVRQHQLLLADEAALGQFAGTEQINRRADANRGGDLDRAQRLGAIALRKDLAGENFLQQHGVLLAGHGHEHQHHVLHGRSVQAFVGVTVSPKSGRDVVKRLSELPELRQLASVSGELDMALLRADTTAQLDALLDEIREIEGVLRTNSSVVRALRVDRQT
jgi:DNA-binding Lrp family transcriptional regulator